MSCGPVEAVKPPNRRLPTISSFPGAVVHHRDHHHHPAPRPLAGRCGRAGHALRAEHGDAAGGAAGEARLPPPDRWVGASASLCGSRGPRHLRCPPRLLVELTRQQATRGGDSRPRVRSGQSDTQAAHASRGLQPDSWRQTGTGALPNGEVAGGGAAARARIPGQLTVALTRRHGKPNPVCRWMAGRHCATHDARGDARGVFRQAHPPAGADPSLLCSRDHPSPHTPHAQQHPCPRSRPTARRRVDHR